MLEIRDIISIVCLCIGLFFCLTTTIGLYRLPDFYSRCHTAGNSETMAMLFMCVGFIIQSGFTILSIKIVILFLILCICNPIGSHILARSAYQIGFPIAGISGKEATHADSDH